MSATAIHYLAFCGVCITVLKELNTIVYEPYMVRVFTVWGSVIIQLAGNIRMNPSMFPKRKRTVREILRHGILK